MPAARKLPHRIGALTPERFARLCRTTRDSHEIAAVARLAPHTITGWRYQLRKFGFDTPPPPLEEYEVTGRYDYVYVCQMEDCVEGVPHRLGLCSKHFRVCARAS